MARAQGPAAPAQFSRKTLTFLRGLKRNNNREWFEERRQVYETEVKAPMLAFLEELSLQLGKLAPEHQRPAGKAIMRIYRDTRFSNDKTPYKEHLGAWFGHRDAVKTSGAGLYVHLSGQDVHVAAGAFMPTPEQSQALRTVLVDEHKAYRTRLAATLRGGLLHTFPVHERKRTPKGFVGGGPADDLLRMEQWGVHTFLPAEEALKPDFVGRVTALFRRAIPYVQWLDAAMMPRRASANNANHLF